MAIYTGSNKHLGGTDKTTTKQQFYYGMVQKNVLIVGATGQLGSEIKDIVDKQGSQLKYFFTGSADLDITHLAAVRNYVEKHAINFIVNCAAFTMVDLCESEEEKCNAINYHGAKNLAKAASEFNCKLIHVSTDYVFDGEAKTPYTETSLINPLSVYGKAKVKAEEAVVSLAPDSIIIRTAWLYSSYKTNFVKTMLRLMNERDTLSIVNDQHGTPTNAQDLAEAITIILDKTHQEEWKPGIYHFSNLGETTWYGFAKKIKEIAGIKNCKLQPILSKNYLTAAIRPRYTVLDKTKIQETYRFIIPHWEESLERFLNKFDFKNIQK